MKLLVVLAMSMLTAYAQDHAQRNWNISVAFLVGANTMDTLSSRGAMESNPLLGRGQFGGRQIAIKSGITAGVILAERMILRKHPETRNFWTWANYGTGAAISAVAVRNWNQPVLLQPALTQSTTTLK